MTDGKQKLKNGLIFQLAKIPTQFHKKQRKKVLKKLEELEIQQLSDEYISDVTENEYRDCQLQSKVFNLKISKGKCSKKGVTFALPDKKRNQEISRNRKLQLQAEQIHVDIKRLRNIVFEKFHIPNDYYTASSSYLQKNFTSTTSHIARKVQASRKQTPQSYKINPQTHRSISNDHQPHLKRSKSAYEYRHLANNSPIKQLPIQSQINRQTNKQKNQVNYLSRSKSNTLLTSVSKYKKEDKKTIDTSTKSGMQRLNFELELLKRKIEMKSK